MAWGLHREPCFEGASRQEAKVLNSTAYPVLYWLLWFKAGNWLSMSAPKPFGSVAAVDAVTAESSDIVHPPRAIPRSKTVAYKNHVIIGDSPAEDEGKFLSSCLRVRRCQ